MTTLKELFTKSELKYYVNEGALLNDKAGIEAVERDFQRIKHVIMEWLQQKRQEFYEETNSVQIRMAFDRLLEELKQ